MDHKNSPASPIYPTNGIRQIDWTLESLCFLAAKLPQIFIKDWRGGGTCDFLALQLNSSLPLASCEWGWNKYHEYRICAVRHLIITTGNTSIHLLANQSNYILRHVSYPLYTYHSSCDSLEAVPFKLTANTDKPPASSSSSSSQLVITWIALLIYYASSSSLQQWKHNTTYTTRHVTPSHMFPPTPLNVQYEMDWICHICRWLSRLRCSLDGLVYVASFKIY